MPAYFFYYLLKQSLLSIHALLDQDAFRSCPAQTTLSISGCRWRLSVQAQSPLPGTDIYVQSGDFTSLSQVESTTQAHSRTRVTCSPSDKKAATHRAAPFKESCQAAVLKLVSVLLLKNVV